MSPSRTTARLLVALLPLVTSGCGDLAATARGPGGLRTPPPVSVVAADGAVLAAEAWTWCWGRGCADGAPPPPEEIPDVGEVAGLAFSFPEPGWTFTAALHSDLGSGTAAPGCGRAVQAPVSRTGGRSGVVSPAGPAGRWRVDLSGRGPDGGDVVTSVLWTTPTAGPVPAPTATLSLLADRDGRLDTYGLELGLQDLDRTPDRASAVVTVTDADGAAVTLPPIRPGTRPCAAGVAGAALLRRAVRFAAPVLELGPGPYRYDVRLVLDGVVHHARATWPDDQIPDGEPATRLQVDPPLPAWNR